MGMNSMRDYVGTPAPTPPVTPKTSLAGLVVVVPAFLVLAFGLGGAEPTLDRLGELSTFALPVIAMIAFWWQGWPGSRLRPGWSGLTDTAIVAVVALVLTEIGRLLTVGENSIPLAVAVFIVIMQLTLVSGGWPLRGLGDLWPGLVALLGSWLVGAALYLVAIAAGMEHDFLGSLLVAIGVWQLLFFVALRGWPFSLITRPGIQLLAGNLGVIAAGVATHVVMLDVIRWDFVKVTAICGCGIAAVLVVSMLFEPAGRLWTVTAFVATTLVLYLGLSTIAEQLDTSDHWVAYAAMNALGIAVILHVVVWRRWPVGGRT